MFSSKPLSSFILPQSMTDRLLKWCTLFLPKEGRLNLYATFEALITTNCRLFELQDANLKEQHFDGCKLYNKNQPVLGACLSDLAQGDAHSFKQLTASFRAVFERLANDKQKIHLLLAFRIARRHFSGESRVDAGSGWYFFSKSSRLTAHNIKEIELLDILAQAIYGTDRNKYQEDCVEITRLLDAYNQINKAYKLLTRNNLLREASVLTKALAPVCPGDKSQASDDSGELTTTIYQFMSRMTKPFELAASTQGGGDDLMALHTIAAPEITKSTFAHLLICEAIYQYYSQGRDNKGKRGFMFATIVGGLLAKSGLDYGEVDESAERILEVVEGCLQLKLKLPIGWQELKKALGTEIKKATGVDPKKQHSALLALACVLRQQENSKPDSAHEQGASGAPAFGGS